MTLPKPESSTAAPTSLIARSLTVLRGERLLFDGLNFAVAG
jgi:hypothetical protein